MIRRFPMSDEMTKSELIWPTEVGSKNKNRRQVELVKIGDGLNIRVATTCYNQLPGVLFTGSIDTLFYDMVRKHA